MMEESAAKANQLYRSGAYADALALYKVLAQRIGPKLFHANIVLCERELARQNVVVTTECFTEEKITVVFITDENYLMPTYVAIYSLTKNRNLNRVYDVNVILLDVEERAVGYLRGLAKDNVNIHIRASQANFGKYKITKNGFHVSPAAILKFELPNILPNVAKVLYLDGDILINCDLTEIYDADVTDAYAAVVEDIKPKIKYKPSMLKKLSIERHRGYFNSGVMLLNLDAMRQDSISERLFDYRESGLNFFMDQDALNVVFEDRVRFLSWKDNLLVTLEADFSVEEIIREYGETANYLTFDDMVNASRITHFASKLKPWAGFSSGPAYIWNQYYLSSGAHAADFAVSHQVRESVLKNNILISLTSYPARINMAKHAVASLLSQEFRAAKVVLWLAEEQFPSREADLPDDLLALKTRGLTIEWCGDTKSFKKLVPALKKYSKNVIVTADDDILYAKDWLAKLVASYMQEPNAIHCGRAHKVMVDEGGAVLSYRKWPREIKSSDATFDTFFTGCGGVLYPPNSLNPAVIDEKLFTALCPYGDDIWFWGMAVLNNTKVKVVGGGKFAMNFVEDTQDVALWRENDVNGRNDFMMANILGRFPEIKQKLLQGESMMS